MDQTRLFDRRGNFSKAFPGAQLLIAKGGELKLHKAYGYHTYDSVHKVELDHLYDLASMTKVLAATLAFMKAYEDLDLDVNSKINTEFKSLRWRKKDEVVSRRF